MSGAPSLDSTSHRLPALRAQVAQLRQELTTTGQAYRQAVAARDSANVIPLLRCRSQLMRQLLEAQCQLLLVLRDEAASVDPGSAAPQMAARIERAASPV